MNTQEIQIQRLYEALKAAAYYIERLELAQRGRKVHGMTEAMTYYHHITPALLDAYERG